MLSALGMGSANKAQVVSGDGWINGWEDFS